jgi:hypothetical protein
MLASMLRVNPDTVAADPGLRTLVDVLATPATGALDIAPLAAFVRSPRRAPDRGLYQLPDERVAEDRGLAIEALLEFNYWHQAAEEKTRVIEGLEASLEYWRGLATARQPPPAAEPAGVMARLRAAWRSR